MKNNETKFVLEACRPNGADASDPAMADAMAEAQRDAALGAWLAREQAHAAVVAAKLGAVTPPAGLREAILAGGRISESAGKKRPATLPWWLLAAAAAVLLGIGGLAWWWPLRGAAVAGDLVAFAAKDTERHLLHGGHGAASSELQRVMAEPARRMASGGLAINFEALRASGCRAVTVGGHQVLEVCFQRDGQWFHCYIGKRAEFPALASASLAYIDHGKVSAASWADATHVFVLASEAGRGAIARLL